MMKIKKEKNEHSLLSNMLFFVGLMFKASPLLVIGELCWGILGHTYECSEQADKRYRS